MVHGTLCLVTSSWLDHSFHLSPTQRLAVCHDITAPAKPALSTPARAVTTKLAVRPLFTAQDTPSVVLQLAGLGPDWFT